ncbi:MAG: transposon-transfer assisting family protein [Eisenbergiella massiliensis]|uniref:transposon-transfer assisting family protein n=1 Tax=Eisenbergiella massiliensis TaxID=1720294 RepID=UPI0023F1ADDC|nr:transposon-transfer assisting family protein [Eisenbergiella massiliensis]MCI6706211.1 transposon-transfer assisting family protein [Eisenbergiella massiliensis]
MFTVEEMNLIQAMNHTCRRMAIFDIKSSIPNIKDHALKELCEKTLKKMSAMTDAEFTTIDFTVYEEDEENE